MKDLVTLETERLILRPFTLEDKYDMFEYGQDDRVGPSAGWPLHKTVEDSEEVIDKFFINATHPDWAIVLKENNKVIGSIGIKMETLDKMPNRCELGYVLSPKNWGQGIVPEASREVIKYAFDTLKLEFVDILHYDFNMKSKRVIEKLGFKFVEFKEKHRTLYDGRVVNSLIYIMDRELYEKLYK